MEVVDIDSSIEYDRTLQSMDIQAALNITRNEATEFLHTFGRRYGPESKYRPKYIIRQSDFTMLRLDGTAAKWVKKNCSRRHGDDD